MSELIVSSNNEQAALAVKHAELAECKARLAALLPALTNLKASMRVFEQLYLQVIGGRYHELAAIEAEIAKMQGLSLDDEDLLDGVALADDEIGCGQNRLHADRVKKLYREFARKFHPRSGRERRRAHALQSTDDRSQSRL